MRTIKLTHEQIDLLVNSLLIASGEYQKQFDELCRRFSSEGKETKIYWFEKGCKIYDLASDIKDGKLDV